MFYVTTVLLFGFTFSQYLNYKTFDEFKAKDLLRTDQTIKRLFLLDLSVCLFVSLQTSTLPVTFTRYLQPYSVLLQGISKVAPTS